MSDQNISTPAPSLGFWRSWAMSLGTMMGSGIFMIPAYLAPYGELGLIAWIPAGLGAIAIALSLGVMARRLPKTGGVYAYARAGFGDFGGFLIAWIYWISVWAACAAIATAFVGYLGEFLPIITSTPLISAAAGLAVIWLIVGINLMGVREMGTVQLATTILKITPLVLIGGAGLFLVSPADISSITTTGISPSDMPPLEILILATVVVTWPFMGLDGATVPAGDVINPSKTIPRALIAATVSATLIYGLSTYGVMGLVPADQLASSNAPFADAARYLFGAWGAGFIAIFAMISCFGALNSNTCVASQVAMAAADDDLFPRRFASRSKKGVPNFSIIIVGVLASLLVLSNYTKGLLGIYLFILQLGTITTLFAYAFASAAALIIEVHDRSISTAQRWREGVASMVSFGFCLWIMMNAGVEVVYWTFALLLFSVPVYVFVTRNKNNINTP